MTPRTSALALPEVETVGGSTPPAVRLVGLTKTFGTTQVVEPVDLEIRRNEFFSILGPSGCGKTTLMRMITGFETPTGGTVELEGRDVVGVPTRKRDLNMLFQSYALFPHLTVAQNVAFELKVRRVHRADITARVDSALELVRMTDYATRRPAELSGGQRQRVALARAVVGRPAVVLLDEPLGALDQQLRKEMQVELKRMQREVGITFIYVTHDQEEALTMSDRIAVMSRGRVLQVGNPVEIYERPASRFVASFIGRCNVLDGVTVADGVGDVAVPGIGPVPARSPAPVPVGVPVTVAVRPERVAVTVTPRSPWSVTGVLESRQFLGDEWLVQIRLSSDGVLVASVSTGDYSSHLVGLQDGDRVWASWRPADALIIPTSAVAS